MVVVDIATYLPMFCRVHEDRYYVIIITNQHTQKIL